MAVATIAAGSSLSSRMEMEQVSMVTNSQRLPGSLAASRAAVARPLTPPAQPSPKMGTRRALSLNPRRGPTRASRLGVAMPVVETVTIPSISSGASPVFSIAPAVRVFVPVLGGHDVALGDPRIVEDSRQPVEQGFPAPECPASAFLRFRLIDGRGWHGRRQREEAAGLHVETYNALGTIQPIAASEEK